MAEHSPLPWHRVEYHEIADSRGRVVAQVFDTGRMEKLPNLELIVRCVNSHEALVAALSRLLREVNCTTRKGSAPWDQAREALKFAEATHV